MNLKQVIHFPETNSVEATWVDDADVAVKCHSYADVQMDMLETDLGSDLEDHVDLIALVRSNIVPYVPPTLTAKDITVAMEALFDSVAQSKNYDNRFTCTLRAGYPGPFQAEGIAFATWMDNQNAIAYTLLEEVQNGTREMPLTIEEALSLLTPITW